MWEDDSIQFARLIGEIASNIELTPEQEECLCESMDLIPKELHQLFERGQKRWDRIKANTFAHGYSPDIAGGYNDDLDPSDQVDTEERISALLFDHVGEDPRARGFGLSEEECNQLGRDILKLVLQVFRKDVFEKEITE